MAKKIKGITIEIGGDTTPLQKALGDVNKKSKDLQSELKSVEKLLRMDPGNVEAIAQKQQLLAEAVENSREKLDMLKTAQAQVNEQFAAGKIDAEQYRAFQREVEWAEAELKKFEGQLAATGGAVETLEDKLQAAGESMSSFGADMSKYVTLPLVAVGAGLSKLGATFDDAFDAIRINSGATGDALEALQDDFKEVAKRVPSDFEQISTSIADYNTRLGITGEILQDLSVQTLNLARITGGNLGKIIEETSQTFQAFNIPVKEYGESLDYIFKVSQSTGIAIERLEANLVKFAPALKQMGFEFKESAALMGYFDKAGVDVEQAMMGLNKALVTMSKAGVKDASEALQMLFDDIQNAPTAMAGAELAIETFGAKAGPALASAIMEGKLGFADLMAELEASEETIESATEATDGWAESLAKLKNRVAMAIEPIASTMFDTLSELVETIADSVTPAIEKMGEAFEGMPKSVQVTILAIMGLLAVTGPLIKGIGAIVMAAPGLSAAFSAMGPIITGITGAFSTLAGVVMPLLGAAAAALGVSIGPLLLALAAIVAVVILVIKHFDEAKQMARDFGEFVGGMLTKLWEGIKKGAAKLAEWITDWWDEIKETWLERFEKVLEFFSNFKEKVFEIFSSLGETLKSIAEFVFKAIFGHFERTAKLLVGGTIYLVHLMVEKWMAFKEGIIDVWEGIVSAIFAFVNNIVDLVNIVIAALNTIQVEIPDWVGGDLGGRKFGIDIAPLEHLDREKQLLTGEQVREEEKKIEVSGRITLEGVDKEGDFLKAVDMIWDELMGKFVQEVRG